MQVYKYDSGVKPRRKRGFIYVVAAVLVFVLAFVVFKYFAPTPTEKAVDQLQFDVSVTEIEKQTISDAIKNQSKSFDGKLNVSVEGVFEAPDNKAHILSAYVPVTNVYSSRQKVTEDELKSLQLFVPKETDDLTRNSIAETVGVNVTGLVNLPENIEDITEDQVALVPPSQLTQNVKLLAHNDAYYLDDFNKGAVFRVAVFSGEGADDVADLFLNDLANKEDILKVNMTGVTALTRVMQKKLTTVSGPLYFSELIGEFLADADITHVSNEVSFREGCQYSNTLFCSPPEFIETLKDSGVDLVELTGNHNNDNGSIYNQESINLYRSLGMFTFGGGLNSVEAAKPHLADQKGSKVTFIGYNMADGAGSGAIARETSAGANIYTEAKAKSDIEAAKQNSQFVVVNIQYAECQAYPEGYVEFPQCDGPIGGQKEAFREMIDLGADMVVGSSAHQPQTYEMYNGKPIYYGLGNLYFDQTQWPGTERGIILTNYFVNGKLIQTKLSPTRYDKSLQTRLLDDAESVYLLERLNAAR